MSSHNEGAHAVLGVLKALLITALKMCALAIAFVARVLSILLDKLASGLTKLATGHGAGH